MTIPGVPNGVCCHACSENLKNKAEMLDAEEPNAEGLNAEMRNAEGPNAEMRNAEEPNAPSRIPGAFRKLALVFKMYGSKPSRQ